MAKQPKKQTKRKHTDHEYAFDVKLAAAIRVRGPSQKAAFKRLRANVDCNTANLGAWENGDPILCEVSIDDCEPHCYEIDGQPTDDEERLSDTAAINQIHALMDGDEWDSDTTSTISRILQQTGREIRDSNATED